MIIPADQRASDLNLHLAASRAYGLRGVVRRTRARAYALQLDLDLDYITGRVHDLATDLNSDLRPNPGDLDLSHARQLADELTQSLRSLHTLARSDVPVQQVVADLDLAYLIAGACSHALARAETRFADPPAGPGTRAPGPPCPPCA